VTQADRGALYAVIGAYLLAHPVLFQRALGPNEPVAAAGALLFLSAPAGGFLLIAGIRWSQGRAAPRLIGAGARALLAFGVILAVGFAVLAPSLAFVLRLANTPNLTPLLALWFAPPVLTLAAGILGLQAGRSAPLGR